MASNTIDEDGARRNYKAPFSSKHPIPTVQGYREHRDKLKNEQRGVEAAQHTEEDESRTKRAYNSVKHIAKNEDQKEISGDPYPTANRNAEDPKGDPNEEPSMPLVPRHDEDFEGDREDNGGKEKKSSTEQAAERNDARQKRKDMKHNKRDDGGRQVTDPVTHLPIIIRDSTNKDLRRAPENVRAHEFKKSATGLSGASKSASQLHLETDELQGDYDGMQLVFPPPKFSATKSKMVKTYQLAFAVGLGSIIGAFALSILVFVGLSESRLPHCPRKHEDSDSWRIFIPLSTAIFSAVAGGGLVVYVLVGWLSNKMKAIWDDEVWDAARSKEIEVNKHSDSLPESVAWMNGVLAAVWPLINPDLFSGVVDMIEDVMQASLPKIIRMVSVDDIGQGSESLRVLGVRWLPTGAAAQTVDEDGNLQDPSDEPNDRVAPGEGQTAGNENPSKDHDEEKKESDEQKKQQEEQDQAVREGLEAEQGDFVNMELAFVYRARSSGRSLKSKVKNAHLFLKFYLPGGIFVPVWVELRGIIGTARVRLQLTPDPPFFALCTLTFLGQPQIDLSCTPLSKKLPNLMNVPLISSFVQSSIDAALAEYVAPKSLTLDLKDMLVGDDFKKDTVTRGVVVVFLKAARDFKQGDGGIGPFKGSSDAYLTCSWGKFGKTLASTRVIEDEQNPKFHEWAYLLVSPLEIDAGERLRVQLWDSDRFTADDDLGRVEVDLHELMHDSATQNKMKDREDRFKSKDADQNMPGTLSWSVGYYGKLGITTRQLETQTEDSKIKTMDELKKHITESAERKLREATAKDESREIEQQKAQDFKEREDAMICCSAPDKEHPSGILSIHIHNITGLEVQSLQKSDKKESDDKEEEDEQANDLPSSYCTIILNHKKIYVTRTKPKNAKPFFNAGTERFIRDWRTTELMISVRDSREREVDPMLGIIYLPLDRIFKARSQVVDSYPIMGGMGFGRARVSIVFRSVELQLPKEFLGWEYGTLEIKSPISSQGLPEDLRSHRVRLYSRIAKVKMVAENNEWKFKNKKSNFLAFSKRYSAALVLEVRKAKLGQDSSPAFGVFWLQDLPDEEEKTISMKIWRGGKDNIKRATTCAGYDGNGEAPLGEIQIDVKFWRGLSGYHKSRAEKSKTKDMKNVMEALDTVNDEQCDDGGFVSDSDFPDSDSDDETGKQLKSHTNQDSSEGSDDGLFDKAKKVASNVLGENDSEDGERGLRGQVRDYKSNHKQLHRQHKGIMQWKAARGAHGVYDKVRQKKNELASVLHHSEKSGGIETEV